MEERDRRNLTAANIGMVASVLGLLLCAVWSVSLACNAPAAVQSVLGGAWMACAGFNCGWTVLGKPRGGE